MLCDALCDSSDRVEHQHVNTKSKFVASQPLREVIGDENGCSFRQGARSEAMSIVKTHAGDEKDGAEAGRS